MNYTQGDGATSHKILSMDASDVRTLSDGRYFLERGGPFLERMALQPFCRHCDLLGLAATVAVTPRDTTIDFRCGHTAGWVKRRRKLELAELFAALGWDLRCTRCRQAAQANNSVADIAFTVECACTTRLMANPLAKAASLSPVDRLGRPEHVC